MTIKKNNLTSISKIKKEYPLFFDKVTMNNFNSIVLTIQLSQQLETLI